MDEFRELQKKCDKLEKVVNQMRTDLDQIKRARSRWWIQPLWQFLVLNLIMWSIWIFAVKY